MIIFCLQSFGIGDVIFTQTLVRNIANGDRILWGVEEIFVDQLNRAYPDITFIDKRLVNVDYDRKDDYVINGMRVLPIRWADVILKVPYSQCMSAKYSLYGQKWEEWTHMAGWCRYPEKEKELYRKLGLEGVENYTLVNRFFGSNSQFAADIPVRGIEMCTMEGYSLFDWGYTIQNASAIHSASTSIIFLLECMNLKVKEVHLYTRKPICDHFNDVQYLLQKHDYVLHA